MISHGFLFVIHGKRWINGCLKGKRLNRKDDYRPREYGLLDKTSLAVQNKVTGLANWLNVYPDGVWTIVGTTKTKEEGEKNE